MGAEAAMAATAETLGTVTMGAALAITLEVHMETMDHKVEIKREDLSTSRRSTTLGINNIMLGAIQDTMPAIIAIIEVAAMNTVMNVQEEAADAAAVAAENAVVDADAVVDAVGDAEVDAGADAAADAVVDAIMNSELPVIVGVVVTAASGFIKLFIIMMISTTMEEVAAAAVDAEEDVDTKADMPATADVVPAPPAAAEAHELTVLVTVLISVDNLNTNK